MNAKTAQAKWVFGSKAGGPRRWISTGHLLFAAAALSGGCQCSHGTGGLTSDFPNVVVPLQLNFGNVKVGTAATLQLPLKNNGGASLQISSQTISGAEFSETTSFNSTVVPGATSTAIVTFAPTAGGPVTGTLSIQDNSQATTVVQLTGTGLALDLTVNPSSIDFGNVPVGVSPAPSQTVTFSNTSASSVYLTLTPSSLPPEFAVAGSAAATPLFALPGSAQTAVTVSFSPDRTLAYSAALSYAVCVDAAGMSCLPAQTIPVLANGVTGAVSIDPSPILFSQAPANVPLSETITVSNTGGAEATVSCIYLQSQGASACGTASALLRLGTPSVPLPATLAADGGSFTFELTYAATGPVSDSLAVSYTAQDQSALQTVTDVINASDAVTPCHISVNPTSATFMGALWGVAQQQNLTVTDTGELGCQITGVAIGTGSDPSFSLAVGQPTAFSLPATLSGGSSASIGIALNLNNGELPAQRNGTLVFQTTDSTQPTITIPLVAQLQEAKGCGTMQTDTFSVPTGPTQVDILWLMDNDDDQGQAQNISSNIPTLFSAANVSGLDLQMAVVTDAVCEDYGSLIPCTTCEVATSANATILTSADTNLESDLATVVDVPDSSSSFGSNCQIGDGGIIGASDEQILATLYLALSSPMLTGHNAGFLRPNAHLAIIAIDGDAEDDNSPQPLDFYYHFLEGLKSNPSLVTFSYVNQGLSAQGMGAFQRLSQLVTLTGGVEADTATSSWTTALSGLWSAATASSYTLSTTPAPSTIAVTINGSAVSQSQWAYVAGTNEIVFNAAPAAGATISVTYEVSCCLPQCPVGGTCQGQADGCGGTCAVDSCDGCCGGTPSTCISLCDQGGALPDGGPLTLCGTSGECMTCPGGSVCYEGTCSPACQPACGAGEVCWFGTCMPSNCPTDCADAGMVCQFGQCVPGGDCGSGGPRGKP